MLPVRMNGLPPFRFVYSIGNNKPDTVVNIPDNNYLLPIGQ